VLGAPWPDVSDANVIAHTDLSAAARLSTVDSEGTLRSMLPWPAAERLEKLAPERLPVPSGSLARLDYSDPEAPVLAVKVQEAFGWLETPRIGDGRVAVLLHLLSPAGRPVAVTRDLASFWRTVPIGVRRLLAGDHGNCRPSVVSSIEGSDILRDDDRHEGCRVDEGDLRAPLGRHAARHSMPGRRSDAAEPNNPTVTFGAYDVTGRPRVLYLMIRGLPRLDD
jgi:hypothetical protein